MNPTMNQSTIDHLQQQLGLIAEKENLIRSCVTSRNFYDSMNSNGENHEAIREEQAKIESLLIQIKAHKRTFNQLLEQLHPFIVNMAQ